MASSHGSYGVLAGLSCAPRASIGGDPPLASGEGCDDVGCHRWETHHPARAGAGGGRGDARGDEHRPMDAQVMMGALWNSFLEGLPPTKMLRLDRCRVQ